MHTTKWLWLALIVLLPPLPVRAGEAKTPNVIIILADDKDYYFCKKHVANEKNVENTKYFQELAIGKVRLIQGYCGRLTTFYYNAVIASAA
jgi:hypothetical protein